MGQKTVSPEAERQARLLAQDNRVAEPDITRILWFPDDQEVRLLEVTEMIPIAMDGEVHPFYFAPSPDHDLPLPSAMAMLRAEEVGRLRLPPEWGGWDDAVEL